MTQEDMNVQTIKSGAYYLLAISALLTGTLLIPSEQQRSKTHVATVSTLAALSGGLGAICLLTPNHTEDTAQTVSSSIKDVVVQAARTAAKHASKWAPLAIAGIAAGCAAAYYFHRRRKQPPTHPISKFKPTSKATMVSSAIVASLVPFSAPSILSCVNSVAPKNLQQLQQDNSIQTFFRELSVKKVLGATLSAAWKAVKFVASTRPGKVVIAAASLITVSTLIYKAYKMSRTRRMLQPDALLPRLQDTLTEAKVYNLRPNITENGRLIRPIVAD